MEVTSMIEKMIKSKVSQKFERANEAAHEANLEIDKAIEERNNWIYALGEKICLEAEEKFEKAVRAKYPKAEFHKSRFDKTPCYEFRNNVDTNSGLEEKRVRTGRAFDRVADACIRIAIENGSKTAFQKIDEYLETVDPIKECGLSVKKSK